MTPLQLLEQELEKYKKALEKSNEQFELHMIDALLYDTHQRNLIPLIAKYEYAIKILKNNP